MKTNLHFSACAGRVVQSSAFVKTFTSGGGGGSAPRVPGHQLVIRPVWVRTDHVRRVEFIVQDQRGVDHSFWVEGYEHFLVRDGQHVAVLSANGRPLRLANFTANYTFTFCTGAQLFARRRRLGFLASAALVFVAALAVRQLLDGVVRMLGSPPKPMRHGW